MDTRIIKIHFSDSRDKARQYRFEDEDVFLVKDNIFVVADGVTLFVHEPPYPNPSPAAEVAKVVSETIYKSIKRNLDSVDKLKVLQNAFNEATEIAKDYNVARGVTSDTADHLKNQYASTTISFGFLDNSLLYYGQLNDCGVMAFDNHFGRELDIVENHATTRKFIRYLLETNNLKPGTAEAHALLRAALVNNNNLEFEGIKLHFGVLNGDPAASRFVRYGAHPLREGHTALLWTDGFVPYVYDDKFMETLLREDSQEKMEKLVKARETEDEKFQHEKTMILLTLQTKNYSFSGPNRR